LRYLFAKLWLGITPVEDQNAYKIVLYFLDMTVNGILYCPPLYTLSKSLFSNSKKECLCPMLNVPGMKE
jgi:hypothetical protein